MLKRRQKTASPIAADRNASQARIFQMSYADARHLILKYEWLRTMGSAQFCFGLSIDGHVAGAVCFSMPVSPRAYVGMLGPSVAGRVLQLCRGASTHWAPAWVPSKLIAGSLRMIAQQRDVAVVAAYADPKAGEIGTIYQAVNGLYIGFTNPRGSAMYVIRGKTYHPRAVHRIFGSRHPEHLRRIDRGYRTIPIGVKHRYLFVVAVGKEKQRLIATLKPHTQPYPKRRLAAA